MAEATPNDPEESSTFKILLYTSFNAELKTFEKRDVNLVIKPNTLVAVTGDRCVEILLPNLQYVNSTPKLLTDCETFILSFWEESSQSSKHIFFEVADRTNQTTCWACLHMLLKCKFCDPGLDFTPEGIEKITTMLKTQPAVLMFVAVAVGGIEDLDITNKDLMKQAITCVAVLDAEGFFLYAETLEQPKHRLMFMYAESVDTIEKVAQQSLHCDTYISLMTATKSFTFVSTCTCVFIQKKTKPHFSYKTLLCS